MRKLDKNKIYAFIGRAVIFTLVHAGMSAMAIYGFMNMTVYR